MKHQTHDFDGDLVTNQIRVGPYYAPLPGNCAHEEHELTTGHYSHASKSVPFEFWPEVMQKKLNESEGLVGRPTHALFLEPGHLGGID